MKDKKFEDSQLLVILHEYCCQTLKELANAEIKKRLQATGCIEK